MTDEQLKNPAAPAAAATIPALWFDAKGYGPTAWSICVRSFDTELGRESEIDQQLGIRIQGPSGMGKTLLAVNPTHHALLDSVFLMRRENIEELHRQLGAWLAAHPAEASRCRPASGSTRARHAAAERGFAWHELDEKVKEQEMPTKKITEPGSPVPCVHPDHNPPGHQVFTPGLWEHTCSACGRRTWFRVDGVTL
jgi:hypothetical protein